MKSSLEPSSLASTGATPSSTGEGGESSPQSSSATSVDNRASSVTPINQKSFHGTSFGTSDKNSVSDEQTSQSPVTDTASKNPSDSTLTSNHVSEDDFTPQKSVEILNSDSTQEASTLFLSVEPLPSSEKLIITTQIGYTDYENPKTQSNHFKTIAASQNQHTVTFSFMEQSSLGPVTSSHAESTLNKTDLSVSPISAHPVLESSIDSSSSISGISHEPFSSTSLPGKASTFNNKVISSSVSTDAILESSAAPTSTIATKQSSKTMEYEDLNGFSLTSETEEFQDNAMISTEKYESSPKQEATKIASTEDMPTSSQSLSNLNTGATTTLTITNSDDNGIISASSRSIIDIKSSENPSTSFGETSMASLDTGGSTVTTSAPKVSIPSTSEASAPSDVEDISSTSTSLSSSKSASFSHISQEPGSNAFSATSMPHSTGTQSIITTGSFLSTGISGFSSTSRPFEITNTEAKETSTTFTGSSISDSSKQSESPSSIIEVYKVTTPVIVDSTVLSSTGSPRITRRESEDLKISTETIFVSKSSSPRVASDDTTAATNAITGGHDEKPSQTKNAIIVTASLEPHPTEHGTDELITNTIAPREMSSSSVETEIAPVIETTVDAAQTTGQQSSSSVGVSQINNNGQIATSSKQMTTTLQNVEKDASETPVSKSSTTAVIEDEIIQISVNTIGASKTTVVDEISSSIINAIDKSTMHTSDTPTPQYSSPAPSSSDAQVNIADDAATSTSIKEVTSTQSPSIEGVSKDLTEKPSLEMNNVSPSFSKVSQLPNTQGSEQISTSTSSMANENIDVSSLSENQITQQSTSGDTTHKEFENQTSNAPHVNRMSQKSSDSQNTEKEEKGTQLPMRESTKEQSPEQKFKTEGAKLERSSSSEFIKLITSSSISNTETTETITKGSTAGESSTQDNVQTESVSSSQGKTTGPTPSLPSSSVDPQQQQYQSTKKMEEKKPPMPSFAFRFMKSRYLSMKYGSYLDNAWILAPVILAVLVIFKSVIWSDFNLRALHPKIKLMIAIALFGFSFRIGWVIFHYQVMVKYRLYKNWEDYL